MTHFNAQIDALHSDKITEIIRVKYDPTFNVSVMLK